MDQEEQQRVMVLNRIERGDDTTGMVPAALFREQEDAQGYLLLPKEEVQGQ